ncbi:MAG: hypothetical protein HYR56_20560 [Acidobacteria bacterium]|nr:hypothetical protein [Acidobacteriota bacterium]MBI3427711.1 hypothetical protein [Acidobacteriota bacterium]
MSDQADFKELGERLHQRLRDGRDSRVSAEIAERFLPPLAQLLRRHFARLPDPQLIESAAIDALLHYFAHPEKFDPAKGSLLGYLRLDATRDLLNLLARQKKVVELQQPLPEYDVLDKAASDPETQLLAQATPLVRLVRACVTDPVDRELLELMTDGVRETAAYAAVLGIANRPARAQEKLVKRHKDRLKKMLRRAWQRHNKQRR